MNRFKGMTEAKCPECGFEGYHHYKDKFIYDYYSPDDEYVVMKTHIIKCFDCGYWWNEDIAHKDEEIAEKMIQSGFTKEQWEEGNTDLFVEKMQTNETAKTHP